MPSSVSQDRWRSELVAMVQRQVDRWPYTGGKRKFSTMKTKVKQMRDVLLNPQFGCTKQLEAPAGLSRHGGLQCSDVRNPSLDERDGEEADDDDDKRDGGDGDPGQGDNGDSTDMDSGAASKGQSPAVHDDKQASYPPMLHEPCLPHSPSHAYSHRILA